MKNLEVLNELERLDLVSRGAKANEPLEQYRDGVLEHLLAGKPAVYSEGIKIEQTRKTSHLKEEYFQPVLLRYFPISGKKGLSGISIFPVYADDSRKDLKSRHFFGEVKFDGRNLLISDSNEELVFSSLNSSFLKLENINYDKIPEEILQSIAKLCPKNGLSEVYPEKRGMYNYSMRFLTSHGEGFTVSVSDRKDYSGNPSLEQKGININILDLKPKTKHDLKCKLGFSRSSDKDYNLGDEIIFLEPEEFQTFKLKLLLETIFKKEENNSKNP